MLLNDPLALFVVEAEGEVLDDILLITLCVSTGVKLIAGDLDDDTLPEDDTNADLLALTLELTLSELLDVCVVEGLGEVDILLVFVDDTLAEKEADTLAELEKEPGGD